MINVGIIGASGYTGGELLRLLINHPNVRLSSITSRTYKGKPVYHVFPGLRDVIDIEFEDIDPVAISERCDVAFTAVPHGVTFKIAPIMRQKGVKLIDLGADYRLKDVEDYSKWYKLEHEDIDGLNSAVYGLPEIFRDSIKDAQLVANPGCYPTSIILGAAPLLKARCIDLNNIIIDSKSGVSGAGRALKLTSHFSEVYSSFKAYGVAGHRHLPEIEQALSKISGEKIKVTFTPHLVPMTRGILTTMYFSIKGNITQAEINSIYSSYYRDEYFVRVCTDNLPDTKGVCGSNFCDVAARIDERTGRLIVVSAIDNLVKGASGQAIQNMNIMFNYDEKMSLDIAPVFP